LQETQSTFYLVFLAVQTEKKESKLVFTAFKLQSSKNKVNKNVWKIVLIYFEVPYTAYGQT